MGASCTVGRLNIKAANIHCRGLFQARQVLTWPLLGFRDSGLHKSKPDLIAEWQFFITAPSQYRPNLAAENTLARVRKAGLGPILGIKVSGTFSLDQGQSMGKAGFLADTGLTYYQSSADIYTHRPHRTWKPKLLLVI